MNNAVKPRILFVVQSLVKGGAERLVLAACREIQRRDLAEVLIVGFDDINEYPGLSKGIPFLHAKINYKLSVLRPNHIEISALLNIIKEFKPDVIHTNCYFQEAPSREVIFDRIKYVTHLHDNMPAFRNLKFVELFNRRRVTEWFEKRRLIRQYTRCRNSFIAISDDTKSYYSRTLPAHLVRKMVLIPNAIDYDRFYSASARIIDRSKTIRLINIGHFAPKKNQVFLLGVMKILKEKNLNVSLELVGDCSTSKEVFMHKAVESGIADAVEMPGLIENVEEHLKSSDIYVHSAYYEPFGLVLLEAMAAGLPVVCLDGKGNRDIMEDGRNGYILKEANPQLFAEKIIDLVNNPALYKGISDYARDYAKKYDIKAYVDQLLKFYSSRA